MFGDNMNNLRALRNDKNLTLRELSQKVSVNYVTLGKLEREETSFNNDYIRILSDFFNVSADYLLGLSKIKYKGDYLKPIPLYNLSDELLDHLPLFNLPEVTKLDDLMYLKLDFNVNIVVINTTFYPNDVLLLKLIKNKNDILPNTFYFIARPQYDILFRFGFTMNETDNIYYARFNATRNILSHDYFKTDNIGKYKMEIYQILSVHRQL